MRIKNKMWKSVEKNMTENGKEYGLFVKEDCKIGDHIIEYVGKAVQKQNKKNNKIYYMKTNQAQQWINATSMGGMARFSNHSCNPNCELQSDMVHEWVGQKVTFLTPPQDYFLVLFYIR